MCRTCTSSPLNSVKRPFSKSGLDATFSTLNSGPFPLVLPFAAAPNQPHIAIVVVPPNTKKRKKNWRKCAACTVQKVNLMFACQANRSNTTNQTLPSLPFPSPPFPSLPFPPLTLTFLSLLLTDAVLTSVLYCGLAFTRQKKKKKKQENTHTHTHRTDITPP